MVAADHARCASRICRVVGYSSLCLLIRAMVILEKPRLAPFIEEMRRNIAKVLGTEASRVNVKAKTNETMGFTGRGEGIAAFAVVTLARAGADEVA